MDNLELRVKITPDGLAKSAAILASNFTPFSSQTALIAKFWCIFDRLTEDQEAAREIIQKEDLLLVTIRLSKNGWYEDDIRYLTKLSVHVRNCLERAYGTGQIKPPLSNLTDQELMEIRNFGQVSLNEFRAVVHGGIAKS